MPIEHHDLVHELPEYRDEIRTLKMQDARFSKLFEEYHHVTKHLEKMEAEIEPASTQTEEELKVKRLHLKDQLYTMLRAAK